MPDLEILEYLKKQGPTNTFRLAHKLEIDRHKLLNIIQKLETKGALEFKSGVIKFLKFPTEEKRIVKPKPARAPSAKNKAKSKFLRLQSENKQLKEKLVESEDTIKELEKKVSVHPKTITRTIIKKVPVIKTVVKRIPITPKIKQKKIKEQTKKKWFKFHKFKKRIKNLKIPKFARRGGR